MAYMTNFTQLYLLWFFLNNFMHSYGFEQDYIFVTFKDLSDVDQRWLQVNDIPEIARLLTLPPYIYHSKLSTDIEDRSKLLDTQNGYSGLVTAVNDSIEGKCSDDLIQVFENLHSQQGLQLLDSEGKLSSGILRGGLIWTGHYSECNNVYFPLDIDGHGDFYGQYCVSSWTLNIGGKYSSLPLIVGLCIPDSCSQENLVIGLKNSSHILGQVPVLKQLKSFVTLNSITCKAKTQSFDAPSIIYLTISASFILFTVLGSALTLYDNYKHKKQTRRGLLYYAAQTHDYGTVQVSEASANSDIESSKVQTSIQSKTLVPAFEKTTPNDDPEVPSTALISKPPEGVIKRILLCFSVFVNGEKILNVKNVDGQFLSIHGIRFLSLSWVILGHTYISSISMIGNKLDVLEDIKTFPFQMLLQAPFSVDSFFLLSGFLLTFLFLKEITKRKGKINWLYFYIHRVWRLTPAYLIAVFFYMLIFKYVGSGPFWNDNNCDESRSTWWKYLFYINNFIPIHQMCVGWSWYIANDMQFYIISPLFLYPLWRWPKIGFTILGSILLATWITTGILSYTYDLIPMFVGVTSTQDFSAYEKRMWDSFDLIYDKPYCRIAPYIIGVILGYILHKTGGKKNFLTWWQQLLGWMIASFCSLSVVFGLYHVEMSRTISLFYNSLCRSSYSIGLAWLIYVCETGHGGYLTKLLSWKLWIPLSRLTYCAYLIHPMIIHGYYQSYKTAIYFTEFFAVTNFLGFLLMSYGLAYVYSLVFESPFMNLEKLLVKNKAK